MILAKGNKNKTNDDYKPIEVKSVFPKKRQQVMNLNGWGFADSYFIYRKGELTFTGVR